MGMKVTGLQSAINGFDRLIENIPDAAGEGVEEGMDFAFERAQIEVPKDTHALANTGHIVVESDSGTTRSQEMVFGEPGEGEGIVDYAAAVHEILKASHDAPTKAKYVEDPIVQSQKVTKKATGKAAQDAVGRSFK